MHCARSRGRYVNKWTSWTDPPCCLALIGQTGSTVPGAHGLTATSSTFQFCENGAKAVSWEANRKRETPEFFASHPVSTRLQWFDHQLEDEGRLTHPMAYDRASDTYRSILWDIAFARIGGASQKS